jgi:hypothetical protein
MRSVFQPLTMGFSCRGKGIVGNIPVVASLNLRSLPLQFRQLQKLFVAENEVEKSSYEIVAVKGMLRVLANSTSPNNCKDVTRNDCRQPGACLT